MRCGASWVFPDALATGSDWRYARRCGLMNAVLLLKLFLVPLLIALVTLAGRRWGPGVAGWLSAFPVVAGPILFFIAVEQGADFAANAAVGTLSAVLAMLSASVMPGLPDDTTGRQVWHWLMRVMPPQSFC